MKIVLILACLLAALSTCAPSTCLAWNVQEPKEEKEPRKYVKSFRGQDLKGHKFLKQNLDNYDFEDANLESVDFTGSSMRNCNFRGAELVSANMSNTDLTGADFRESDFRYVMVYNATLNQVNFEGLDLSSIQLNERKLRGANLRNVKGMWFIYKADFYEADLRGANFTDAIELQPAAFRKAKYDQFTRWHKDFDPMSRGLVFIETKSDEKEAKRIEDEFKKLDANGDGVLTGDEALAHQVKDIDGNKEISKKEFSRE